MPKAKKPLKPKILLTIEPTVPPPYREHTLAVSLCLDGTVQLTLTEEDEDFPEAFISLSAEQRKQLAETLLKA